MGRVDLAVQYFGAPYERWNFSRPLKKTLYHRGRGGHRGILGMKFSVSSVVKSEFVGDLLEP
jgi:hypothetical protein